MCSIFGIRLDEWHSFFGKEGHLDFVKEVRRAAAPKVVASPGVLVLREYVGLAHHYMTLADTFVRIVVVIGALLDIWCLTGALSLIRPDGSFVYDKVVSVRITQLQLLRNEMIRWRYRHWVP